MFELLSYKIPGFWMQLLLLPLKENPFPYPDICGCCKFNKTVFGVRFVTKTIHCENHKPDGDWSDLSLLDRIRLVFQGPHIAKSNLCDCVFVTKGWIDGRETSRILTIPCSKHGEKQLT